MATGDDDKPSAAVIQEELHKEEGENCMLLFVVGQTLADLEAISRVNVRSGLFTRILVLLLVLYYCLRAECFR